MAVCVLLMTATIAPQASMPNTARRDPALRRTDYETALRHYLSLPKGVPDAIVFAENSGADISSLEAIAERENPEGRNVVFHSFSSACPPERGKGYAELDILDRAFDAAVPTIKGVGAVWKLTGRLIVKNFQALAATTPDLFSVYCDLRVVPFVGESLGGNNWMDTRLFATSVDGYKRYFYGRKEEAHYVIEKHFCPILMAARREDRLIFPRFRIQPELKGVSADSQKDYESVEYRAKDALRRTARRIAPALWL